MPRSKDGAGSIYQRGNIWWVKVHVDGKPIRESSGSEKYEDAKRLRDKLLGQKHRGEISGGNPARVTVGELLDDFLVYAKSNVRESTEYIYRKVTENSLRPFFATLKAQKVTTDKLNEYRQVRLSEGRSEATANRELALVRIAYRLGQGSTPPKVLMVPKFPMVKEDNARQGFLRDEQYSALLAALPTELKSLFVASYETGIRMGELLAIRWEQVDFEAGFIVLQSGETKNGAGRAVPIVPGDMADLLSAAKQKRDASYPTSPWVFNRHGEQIKDFRGTWAKARESAGVPDLNFHDLRRTAVRNMRKAGVPQVVRMKISGHKTDSMERRYNIVDTDDIAQAKALMGARAKAPKE
jgi:integrase